MQKIDKSILKQVITPRDPISFKGNYGKILIIAGSSNFGGAAIMSASAAIHSGAGLVTVATIPEKFSAINTRIPEAMTIDYHHLIEIIDAIKNADVIAIGPGLGTSQYSESLISLLLDHTHMDQTIIFDASALTIIAQANIDISKIQANVILTPHQGEWQRLSQLEIPEQSPKNNLEQLHELAPNALLIVKKHLSEVYYEGSANQIIAGNPGMATGGMGDTLTGIIAAFVGQFGFSQNTVEAALFLHSDIADKIYKKNYVVLPEKLIEAIPKTMQKIVTNKKE
ncbi:NAD(P)H-hydrate dehydratase [Companilactobacillus zhongbaensis]|uniref:NAD(P)H-hydrate dehydratase n=1 Tax=Companilactobacillus zhongbaensis TaxID=2486009 RepID=UPI000F78CF48|nr:NAD(P)H-hydrate dehydratase [Companilactobacillus zhongbaensis]